MSVADALKSLEVQCFKADLHCIRFSSVFVRFFLLHEKECSFSSHFYMSIRTNQTVTYWTKVFQKIFFVMGYSPILKYHSHRLQNFYQYVTVYLVQIWTYKNVGRKSAYFVDKQKRILCKFTFIAATLLPVGAIYCNFFNLVFKLFKFKPSVIDNIYLAFYMCTFQRS